MDFDWEFKAPHWCDFTKEIANPTSDLWFETPGSISPMTRRNGIRTPLRQRKEIGNTPITKKIQIDSLKTDNSSFYKTPSKKVRIQDEQIKFQKKPVHQVKPSPKAQNQMTQLQIFRTILPW